MLLLITLDGSQSADPKHAVAKTVACHGPDSGNGNDSRQFPDRESALAQARLLWPVLKSSLLKVQLVDSMGAVEVVWTKGG